MELLLGFKESSSSSSLKLVPWISWDEWEKVRVSLFSSDSYSISSALHTVAAWRSRGCLPLVVEITASLVEIQQKDSFFRVESGNKDAPESEDILAMLYCMAIMRLVNGVVEKTRKKTEVSIGEVADTINIPRVLIDIRHECSHRDLPSLRLVRLATIKALDWLKSYYWKPQKQAIQFQNDGAFRIRKKINSGFYELAFSLKKKQAAGSSSPIKSSKKQISKAVKKLLCLYSSSSVEVVSVVVELLLKESGSSDDLGLVDDSAFDYWKPVITKLSTKEPEFLLTLVKTVHERIETQESMTCGNGKLSLSEATAQENRINRLSDLFAWLITILKEVKAIHEKKSISADTKLPESTLVELLRKSLLISRPGNSQLKSSTLVLADMVGNNSLAEKLNKLFLPLLSDPEFDEENSSIISSENLFAQQKDYIDQAAKKLALLKHQKLKSKTTDTAGETYNKRRWVVVKKWNKCPIGMLPINTASSGVLPVLNWDENNNQVTVVSENKEQDLFAERYLKRKPDFDLEFSNEVSEKKLKENEINNRNDSDDSFSRGKLMIGGVWKRVEKQDLFAIAADIRVLI